MLAIDTSNQALGVALMQKNQLVAEVMTNINKDHSSRLMPVIVDLMERVDMTPEQLDKIIIANGPGSYTGTRIGVTTAKTMAWALDIPIYPISSLKVLALNGELFDGYICPFFDARRKTVFTSLYKSTEHTVLECEEECNISMNSWLTKLDYLDEKILFLSPHIEIYREMITEKLKNKAIIPEHPFHIAKPSNLFLLIKNEKSVDTHLVTPNYLRMTEAEVNWLKKQEDANKNG